MAEFNAFEIYMLQLVNRARLDPAGEAARYKIDLNQGLAAGTISVTPKQPLVPNPLLNESARAHSQWMLDTGIFSHTGASGSQPFDRMTAAGYPFAAPYAAGENIAFSGTTGTLGGLASYIEDQHRGLFLSPSHRTNIEEGSYREIGISQVTGAFTSGSTTYNASMITQNFATTGTTSFLGGVIYNDLDLDNFYDPGEGVAGVTIRINGIAVATSTATSTATGAYYLPLANGTHALQMDGGGLSGVFATNVTMAGLNLQVNARAAEFAAPAANLAIAATNANRLEGNGGTTGFTFTASRNGNLAVSSTAAWSAAGIAGSGTQLASAADFAGTAFPSGTVSFAPGESTRTITIPVLADTIGESNERFAVTLASPSAGTTLATATAQGIIRNDDTSLALSANISRAEGNSGSTGFTFTVARATTLANDAFTFIGTAAFSGTPGELRWEDQGATRLIQANTNTNPAADLTILLTAPGPIDATWFVL